MFKFLRTSLGVLTRQHQVQSNILVNTVRYTSNSQPGDFVRTNLHNGVGRYVCQMSRVTFKFCKEQTNSLGMREFIESNLVDFARKNPGIVVYLQPRRHRRPKIVAEYLNGMTQQLDVHQYTKEQILKWLEFMRTRNGNLIARLLNAQHTDNPSIQGVWNPFINKTSKLAVESFPSKEYSKPIDYIETATDKILDLYEHQKQQLPSSSTKLKNIVKQK